MVGWVGGQVWGGVTKWAVYHVVGWAVVLWSSVVWAGVEWGGKVWSGVRQVGVVWVR